LGFLLASAQFGRFETIHRSCDHMPSTNAITSAKGTPAVKREGIYAAHGRGNSAIQKSLLNVKVGQGSRYGQCRHLERNLAMQTGGIRHEIRQEAQLTKLHRDGSVNVGVGAHVEQLQGAV
jgi:hypothetical protein